MDLGDVCSWRQGVLHRAKTLRIKRSIEHILIVRRSCWLTRQDWGNRSWATVRFDGKTRSRCRYLNWPIIWNMLLLAVFPEMGRAVSRGALATKDMEANGAGFVCARNGVWLVVVGPVSVTTRLLLVTNTFLPAKDCGVVWKGSTGTDPTICFFSMTAALA